MKTIREVADLAGVTIRTLRHYDKIGLLEPQARSESSGVRLYGRDELLRLREILIWRQLGFPLGDIAALIDDPDHDRSEALRRQRELAGSQRDKFHALTRGLDTALAAIDAGGTVAEDQVFHGFARSLAEDDGTDGQPTTSSERPGRAIPTFALISGRSRHGTADGIATETLQRIVATDPIELGESLIALGVLPLGTGTYEDRFSDGWSREPGCWTWPLSIERPVRERIVDLGYRGSDTGRVEGLAPDRIIDLTRYRWDGLSAIAPTSMVPSTPEFASCGGPAFRHSLRAVGELVGRRDRVDELLSGWDARTRALSAHLRGKEVGVIATWGSGWWGGALYAPTPSHQCQVFSALGLEVLVPARSEPRFSDAVVFEEDAIDELRADALFVHTRYLKRERVDALLRSTRVSSLPAARNGRIYELGWEFVNSGWFGAHWQLRLIAHAFGLTQLCARGDDGDVYLAVNQRNGSIEFTTGDERLRLTLFGADIEPATAEIDTSGAGRIVVSPEVSARLCAIPEAYSVAFDGCHTSAVPLTFDRESALMRIACSPSS